MLGLITRISNKYEKYLSHFARQRTLLMLSQQSDATLRDIGVSRELLRSGVAGWPWESTEPLSRQCSHGHGSHGHGSHGHGSQAHGSQGQDTEAGSKRHSLISKAENPALNSTRVGISSPSIVSRSRATYHRAISKARAIRELNAYSDRELRDLGITRGDIVEAVNFGRPGIERAVASASLTTSLTTKQTSVAKPQCVADTEIEGLLEVDKQAA